MATSVDELKVSVEGRSCRGVPRTDPWQRPAANAERMLADGLAAAPPAAPTATPAH